MTTSDDPATLAVMAAVGAGVGAGTASATGGDVGKGAIGGAIGGLVGGPVFGGALGGAFGGQQGRKNKGSNDPAAVQRREDAKNVRDSKEKKIASDKALKKRRLLASSLTSGFAATSPVGNISGQGI
jgi:hypothetical protein